MKTQARGAVEMVAAMTISGTISWFVVKSGQSMLDVVFWRCLFGAVALLAICGARGLLTEGAPSLRQLALATLGGAAMVMNWLLLFAAYARASISIAATVYNTQPLMLVGLGAVFFGERLTATKLGCLTLAFGGLLLLVWGQPGATPSTDYLRGIAMALGAAIFCAVAAIFSKRLTGVPPIVVVLFQVLVGIMILAPFAHLPPVVGDASTWAKLITLGVIHTGLAFVLLYDALQKLPTYVVGALSFTYPLVAIAVDILAFGHRLQPFQILGGIAILVAAAGATAGWSLERRSDVHVPGCEDS